MNFVLMILLMAMVSLAHGKAKTEASTEDGRRPLCKKALPLFQRRANDALEKARKLSFNFETFRPFSKNPECKVSHYEDDGGSHCAYECVHTNGESAEVKMHLYQRRGDIPATKKTEALEDIELFKLEFISGA